MAVKLNHPFLYRCLDRKGLLTNCQLFNTFAGRLEKQAKLSAKKYKDKEAHANDYKGWGFEFFCEFLIKLLGNDKRIGIYDYKLVEEDEDYGVDGCGIGIDGKPAAVQIKYRQSNRELAPGPDRLPGFVLRAMKKHGVQSEENKLIITAGKGLHSVCEEMIPGVRCINRRKLRIMVDKNVMFWNTFRDSWEESIK